MTIKAEFDKRIIEIELFYEVLKVIELDNPKLSATDILEESIVELKINSTRIDIFRSTAYLLLYNLIESTIYNSITSIFDSISDNNVKYFEMIEEVQKYWLNNLYKHDEKKKKETIIETFMNIANQIFNNTIELASNEISYGGSLDADAIFKTAKSMKIEIGNIHRVYDKGIHGQSLVDIKNKRNWLAHGEKTFTEIGSISTYSQLVDAKDNVKIFLKEFINSVETYIKNQHYKVTNP
ncbi:MAG: hypothetical protein EAZ53_04460 [Bacteroidetes bacterium]|nr:MAG: hypothetical protein EAZ53_04460 [Bacteroidota bacterium]